MQRAYREILDQIRRRFSVHDKLTTKICCRKRKPMEEKNPKTPK